jgi:hypothetical protein
MRKRCIRQSALNVEKIVKFRSNLIQLGQFTAETAIRRKHQQEEDTKLTTIT